MLTTELKKVRRATGLTQEQSATKAGISREYVNYVERGKRQPTVAIFVRLWQAMNAYPPDMLAEAIS